MTNRANRQPFGTLIGLCLGVAAFVGCGDDVGGDSSGEVTGGGGTGAGTSSGGVGGTGGSEAGGGGQGGDGGTVVPVGKVPMFVAQGHVGTTVVSCDDGKSWTGLRSFESEANPLVCGSTDTQCFSGSCSFMDGDGVCEASATCDCDHHPGSGKGLAYGDGAFVATFGWGQPGVVMRSTNGLDWTVVDTGHTYADVAAGEGRFVLSDRTPKFSTDAGETFMDGGPANHQPWNVRRMFYLPDSGLFMQSAASGDERDILVSADLMTWSPPTTLPYDCTAVSEAIQGGGVLVIRGGDGYVCRSADDADTFERVDLPNAPGLFSGPIWDGSEFTVWGTADGIRAYKSADGQTWTETATNLTGNNRFGEVALNPVTGVMVASKSEWQQWYEQLAWYRSTDGITWETLSPEDGVQTHPMREMTFGYGDPSDLCPLR